MAKQKFRLYFEEKLSPRTFKNRPIWSHVQRKRGKFSTHNR